MHNTVGDVVPWRTLDEKQIILIYDFVQYLNNSSSPFLNLVSMFLACS